MYKMVTGTECMFAKLEYYGLWLLNIPSLLWLVEVSYSF